MQYIFKDKDGKYIALDQDSGGYPYTTENLFSAHVWHKREDAFRYKSMFEDWDLYEVKGVVLEKIIPIVVTQSKEI